jgi:hypothetical protein
MDPYLEDPGRWNGVHSLLIYSIRVDVNRRLGPRFVADVGATEYAVAATDRRWAFPDVFEFESGQAAKAAVGTRIEAPVQVLVRVPDTISQAHVTIRDSNSLDVVTIVEVLSPINKAPATSQARADFLRKHDEVIASRTHWVELICCGPASGHPRRRGWATSSPSRRVSTVRASLSHTAGAARDRVEQGATR